jgi:predicted permease
MSVVLVTAAVLFAGTLHALRTHDAGYKRDHLLTLVLFPQSGASHPNDLLPYYQRLADKVRHLPGVQDVSYSEGGPANEFEWFSPVSLPSGAAAADAVDETVAPGFFSVAGMRVLAGREFSWSDAHRPARLAIISESLSDRLFERQNPIGRTVQVGPAALKREVAIVGIVNSASLWKIETYHPMAIYLPLGQARQEYEPILDVRTTEDPGRLKQVIERVIHGFGYHDSIRSMTVEERLESYITVQRLTSLISTFFGALALLIVCVGVYGLIAFNVAGRTHELGIRSALGARRTQLIRLILQDSMLLAGIGCACGLAASSLAARWIRSLVFGISPMSPAVLVPALLGLLAVAWIAAFLPSWRASNADPMSALRSE